MAVTPGSSGPAADAVRTPDGYCPDKILPFMIADAILPEQPVVNVNVNLRLQDRQCSQPFAKLSTS
jgi:hypothetical protein